MGSGVHIGERIWSDKKLVLDAIQGMSEQASLVEILEELIALQAARPFSGESTHDGVQKRSPAAKRQGVSDGYPTKFDCYM